MWEIWGWLDADLANWKKQKINRLIDSFECDHKLPLANYAKLAQA